MLSKGSFKSSLRLQSQTFVLITVILALIISIGGGLFNVKLHEHKSTIGNSFEPRSFECSSVLYNLREFLATITSIIGVLCFCINKGMTLGNNETGSRSPCMRPRSDPPKMKNSNVVRSRLIILINEEINEAN